MEEHLILNTFETLNERAKIASDISDKDYVKDGLIHCHKCGTPKETVVRMPFGEFKVHCTCKCKTEENAKKREEFEEKQRRERFERMRRESFADGDYADCTFGRDDGSNPGITRVAMRYVDNFDTMVANHKGLLLYGNPGTGKSFTAACIMNALIEKGYACLMTSFPAIVNRISGMYDGKQEYIENLNRFDLLVIDDFSVERNTDYVNEIVQTVIDSRYRAGKPMIVTTNLSTDDMKSPANVTKERMYSRLFEMCVLVKVQGDDRRKLKARADHNAMKELLGL